MHTPAAASTLCILCLVSLSLSLKKHKHEYKTGVTHLSNKNHLKIRGISAKPGVFITRYHVPYGGLAKLRKEIKELSDKKLHDPNFGHYKTTHEKDFPGYPSGMYRP